MFQPSIKNAVRKLGLVKKFNLGNYKSLGTLDLMHIKMSVVK